MTSIPPAAPVPPPTPVTPTAAAPSAPTTAATGSTALLTQLPASVRASQPGTVITGTVTGRDAQGQTLIQTDSGIIAMRTLANLSVGSQVSLQVQVAGSQLQAVILSAVAPNARGGSGALQTPGAPAAAGTAASAAATTVASTVATGGAVLSATVIGSASGPPPQGAPPAAPAARPGATSTPTPIGAPATTPGPVAAAGAPAATPPPGLPPPVLQPPSLPSAATAPLPGGPAPAPGAPPAPAALAGGSPIPGTTANPATAAAPTVVVQQAAANRTVSAALASYAHAPGATPTAASPPAPAGTPLPAGAPSAPTQPLQPQPAGTQVQIRLATPGTPTPSTAVAAQATLVGRTPTGQAIVDTPVGRLAVNLPPSTSNLMIGSPLSLEIVSLGSPGSLTSLAAASSPAAGARGVTQLGHEWSSLKAAMAALAEIDQPLARQILEISLPRLGTARFLGQILNHLAGGGAKDARALLGDTAHAVLERNGRADILARLDAEMREMVRLNSSASDWNVLFLPLMDLNELRQMRVYTRKRKAGGKSRDPGRFVVEVEFDQLGEMQIDGLIQKPRIDLILRSHVELSPALQAGIAQVFGKTCDESKLVGKIFFQAMPHFPVSPLDEIDRAGPGLSI